MAGFKKQVKLESFLAEAPAGAKPSGSGKPTEAEAREFWGLVAKDGAARMLRTPARVDQPLRTTPAPVRSCRPPHSAPGGSNAAPPAIPPVCVSRTGPLKLAGQGSAKAAPASTAAEAATPGKHHPTGSKLAAVTPRTAQTSTLASQSAAAASGTLQPSGVLTPSSHRPTEPERSKASKATWNRGKLDPQLVRVIDAWAILPGPTREAISAMIDATSQSRRNGQRTATLAAAQA